MLKQVELPLEIDHCMPDGRVWAATVEEFDALVSREPSLVTAAVTTSDMPERLPQEVVQSLHDYVGGRTRSGFLLVKTSTTGRRSASHEISPGLLESVVQGLLEHTSAERIILADGPVFATFPEECERLGWGNLCRRTGIQVADLNYTDVTQVAGWPVSSVFLEADAVISLTRAKTHRRTGVSLSLKSLVGALSGRETGLPKMAGRHKLLSRLLVDLEQACPPIFSVVDGRNGIEGEGPMSGDPVPSRFLAFGEGLLGPDLRATIEMGFDPSLVPGFHRPWPAEQIDRDPVELPWARLRVSNVDFLPAFSCSWLYRSLTRTRRRGRRYAHLLSGARECWAEES